MPTLNLPDNYDITEDYGNEYHINGEGFLTISSNIGAHADITAASLNISGDIGAGADITATTINIFGSLGADARITALTINISGDIGAGAHITATTIMLSGSLGANTTINGNIHITGGSLGPNCVIKGIQTDPDVSKGKDPSSRPYFSSAGFKQSTSGPQFMGPTFMEGATFVSGGRFTSSVQIGGFFAGQSRPVTLVSFNYQRSHISTNIASGPRLVFSYGEFRVDMTLSHIAGTTYASGDQTVINGVPFLQFIEKFKFASPYVGDFLASLEAISEKQKKEVWDLLSQLGVKASAYKDGEKITKDLINNAYRIRVILVHPDKNAHDSITAERLFKETQAAREKLMDKIGVLIPRPPLGHPDPELPTRAAEASSRSTFGISKGA